MSEPRAFIAGWPVAHSRSPLIHCFWLRRHGIVGDYRREAVRPEDIGGFLADINARGYVGGNVTVPHKEAAAAACGSLTPVAKRLGAVNTVWLKDGRLHGDNTDIHGFAANLDGGAPEWRSAGSALVLGAGGAARGVVQALVDAGVREIAVLNRTQDRAAAIAGTFPGRARAGVLTDMNDELPGADIVVNTTSAGMEGASELPIDWTRARRGAIAADVVYVPLLTPFLAGAAAQGLRTVDGLGMLLHQAAPGFERWFGVRPEVDAELRRHIVADLHA